MTAGGAPACPRCARVLGPESWAAADRGTCAACATSFEFLAFPALGARRPQVAAQAAVVAEESVCFFHADNRAEAICDGCGRLLCPVCAVPFSGQRLCPACIAGARGTGTAGVMRDRVLYDGIALGLAGWPLLIWPLTLITAPSALGMVIYGWNKPGSLVRGVSRPRLVIAAILALLEIGGWATLGVMWWLKK